MGLAPLPAEIVGIRAQYLVHGLVATIGFHLWNPGLGGPSVDTLEQIATDFIANENAYLVALMHDGVEFSACTAFSAGSRVTVEYAFSSGVWSGGQAQGITVGFHWIDGSGRRSSSAITHLPGCPDAFIDSNQRLSQVGYGNLADKGPSVLHDLGQHDNGAGGLLVPVIVHRRRNGARLPAPVPRPIQAVQPMLLASTIGRRMNKTRGIPPS